MLALVFATLMAVSPLFGASKVFKSVVIHGTFSNYSNKKFYGEYQDWEAYIEATHSNGRPFKSKPVKVNEYGDYEMIVPNLPAGEYHLHFGQPGKPHSTKTFDVDREDIQVDMSWDV